MMCGGDSRVLIVIRGNSASGKTSLAQLVRRRLGRGVAIVSQDVVRRAILWEHESATGVNIGLIGTMARYALEHGYHVIVEGMLKAHAYAGMLEQLVADHPGLPHCFYLDVSWAETLRRHATRPQAAEYGPEVMRQWFKPLDLLPRVTEHRLPETMSLTAMADLVIQVSGLVPVNHENTGIT